MNNKAIIEKLVRHDFMKDPIMKIDGMEECNRDVIVKEWIDGEHELKKKTMLTDANKIMKLFKFQLACQHGFIECVEYCLNEYNFTIDDIRMCDNIVITNLSGIGHYDIIKLLFEYEDKNGNKLNIEDLRIKNNLPIRLASANGHDKIVEYFLNYKDSNDEALTADDVMDCDSFALRYACGHLHKNVVDILLKFKDKNGKGIEYRHRSVLLSIL
jgi:hypothetical protein